MSRRLARCRAVLLALALLPAFAGCSYDEGGSLGEYLTDARIQRQNGDLDAALALLREALAAYPESEEVRVELAATLFEASPLSLFDLADAAEYVIQEPRRVAPRPPGATCATSQGPLDGFEPFDPLGFDAYANIAAAGAALDSIEVLLTSAPGGTRFSTLEGRLREVDLCTVADPATGVLRPYGRDGILAALRADGLSDLQIGELLATYAVTQLVNSYDELFAERLAAFGDAVELYRVQEGDTRYISFCTTSGLAFVQVYAVTVEPAEAFLRAVLAIELRAYLLGYPEATDDLLVDAVEALLAIQRELANCPG